MSLLLSLWWSSLAMGAAALVWMAALVFARVWRTREDGLRDRDRIMIQRACLAIVAGEGDAIAQLRGVRWRARLLAETFLEFLAIVRGAERERLVSAFLSLSIDDRFRDRLFRGAKPGRIAAAEALAAFPGVETEAALARLLDATRDAEVRIAAIRTLVDLDRPPALRALLDDLRSRGVAESLLYLPIVRRLVALDADAALAAFEDRSLESGARAVLADGLGVAGDYRAMGPLSRAASDPDSAVRVAAVRGLGALAHPLAAPTLTAAVSDPDWTVRAAACEALARTGLTETAGLLTERLADPVWWVRFQAAEALTHMGEAGVSRLRLAAQAPVDMVRRAAGLALAEKGLVEPALEATA